MLQKTKNILRDPAPLVWTVDYADFAIVYRVKYYVAGYEHWDTTRDEFMTRVWYACKRHSINIPFPIQMHYQFDGYPAKKDNQPDVLRAFTQFGIKDSAALTPIAERLDLKQYGRGEQVVAEGQKLPALHLVLSGHAGLTIRDFEGHVYDIAQVGRGEFFGENSLLSQATSEVTVTALEDLEVLVIDAESFQALVERLPRLARDIGAVMDTRRKAIQNARKVKTLMS